MAQTVVAVNAAGLRIGQDHPQAKLTDAEVELIRKLNDDGMHYGEIADKFEISKWTVGRICRFERRVQTAERYKPVMFVHQCMDIFKWYEKYKLRGAQGELKW